MKTFINCFARVPRLRGLATLGLAIGPRERGTLALGIALWLAGALLAPAAIVTWNSGFAGSGVIPDGNSAGWSDSRTVSVGISSMTDVNVFLTITGGWNGDYYAYLTHGSGFTVLLNRVGRTASDGFGYSDAGLNVKLDDTAASDDIHKYQNVVGYATLIGNGSSFQPDGRNINPLLVVATDGRTKLLDQFNGFDPNGEWTLFIADLSSGEQGTVTEWGLELSGISGGAAVPEPGQVAMMLVALGLGAWTGWRHQRRPRAHPIPGSL